MLCFLIFSVKSERCPVKIKLAASARSKTLVLKELCLQHDYHPCLGESDESGESVEYPPLKQVGQEASDSQESETSPQASERHNEVLQNKNASKSSSDSPPNNESTRSEDFSPAREPANSLGMDAGHTPFTRNVHLRVCISHCLFYEFIIPCFYQVAFDSFLESFSLCIQEKTHHLSSLLGSHKQPSGFSIFPRGPGPSTSRWRLSPVCCQLFSIFPRIFVPFS